MKGKLVTILLFLAFAASAQTRTEKGNLVIEGIPDIPKELTERLDQYQNSRSAAFTDFGPGGKGILILTRFGESNQVHLVKQPGGYREQLTFAREPVGGGTSSPDTSLNVVVYSKDAGGNENFQYYMYDRGNGNHTLLTDGTSKNSSLTWNKKGHRFAFTSNKRNLKDLDIYVKKISGDTTATLLLKREGGGWGIMDWSDDEQWMIITNYLSVNQSKLYLVEVATGKTEEINPTSDTVAYGGVKFAKGNSNLIYLVSDQGSEYKQLASYDLKNKKLTPIPPAYNYDVESLALSDDGKFLAYTVNWEGYSKLFLRDLKAGKTTEVPVSKGTISGIKFNKSSNELAYTMATSKAPADVYSLNLSNMKSTRWTFSETGGLNTSLFVEPALIKWKSFDGIDIPGFLYKPASAKGKMPVVINIHGGPESQTRPGFNPVYQFICNELGVAVIAPNVRGSTGYGKNYVKLDNGYLRENSVKDIGALLDWIATQPDLDASRVAVWGGSYGGYMTLASMTHYNDRLRAGIDVVGISNFVTFLKNTSDYRRDLRRVEYGDEQDTEMQEFLEKISPNNNVKKITKPMFIVQGLNDPRVPVTEAEQMVEALKKNGSPVWYLMAKDEGHGFNKKSNRDYYTAAVMLFLDKYLKPLR